jgi:hypothetical protein
MLNTSTAYTWASVKLTAWNYNVGKLDFGKLGEDRNKFSDEATKKDYIYAYLAQGRIAVYSVAGQIKDSAGNYTAVVKGNFYNAAWDNIQWLITDSGSVIASTWVIDNQALTVGATSSRMY